MGTAKYTRTTPIYQNLDFESFVADLATRTIT